MPEENQIDFTYTSHVLTRSQSIQPKLLLDVLIISSAKENWITLLINLHTAIFCSIFLLAFDFDLKETLVFLTIHIGSTAISGMIVIFLINQSETTLLEQKKIIAWLLVFSDAVNAIAWGLSVMFLLTYTQASEYNTLFALLLAAGISTAALSAKLLRVLIIGRLLVFFPVLFFLITYQPENWFLYSIAIILSCAIALGIGYVIHIQLLREASLVVEVNEAKKRTAQEAAFREYFLRSITHDLSQPLSSIRLFNRALSKSPIEKEEKSVIASIELCLDSANEILDNVAKLVWVKDQLPEPNIVRVSIDSVLSPLVLIYQPRALEKGLILNYVKTSLYVLSDESYLERAIRNLLENAIENTERGEILVGARNRSSKVEIQVLDTGCGIEEKFWKKIFKKYQRIDEGIDTKKNHMGLGLSIVYNIANSLSAEVTLKSQLGKGSCFGLLLPAYVKSSINELIMPSKTGLAQSFLNKKVLIIDDDVKYAQFVQTLLLGINIESTVICEMADIKRLSQDGMPEADYYIIDYHLKELNGLMLLQTIPLGSQGLLISQIDDPEINTTALARGVSFSKKSDDQEIMRSLFEKFIYHS